MCALLCVIDVCIKIYISKHLNIYSYKMTYAIRLTIQSLALKLHAWDIGGHIPGHNT